MCGIVGAVGSAPVDRRHGEEMRDCLAHRGPDHAGSWVSDDARVYLGHRRLAIVDLSPEANQPFLSSDGRFAVTFNGEIYNFQQLRTELHAQGVHFRTLSDTEVLVEAFRYWGERCLERLSGMFAFAIWDSAERRLLCARDRAGEKPFYYATLGGTFIFASELKALVSWPGFRRRLHLPALIDYLSFGFVADPKSIWEGCLKLAPGHCLSVAARRDGTPVVCEPRVYWDMEFHPDESVADWGPAIRETLQTASTEMAFADVPVGAFLSGGVDSSSVTAALARAGRDVHTFTVGFEEEQYDERPWASRVARLYGTTHTERVVRAQDVAPVFQKLLWHYDEPFNDYSYLPTFYVCREARQLITVALSGDGGDELFAGYRKYQRLSLRQEVRRVVPRSFARLGARTATLLSERNSWRGRLSHYGMDESALMMEMLCTGFPISTLRAAARGPLAAALKHYTPMDTVLPLLRRAPPAKVGLVNTMRYLDLKLTLAGDILVKVDRASMAVSLEVRPVFLHRDVLALAARIPATRLVDGRSAKRALKAAVGCWLPPAVVDRAKMGFAMPLNDWTKGELSQLFAHNHDRGELAELLDEARLRGIAGAPTRGAGGQASTTHALFFLRHWLAAWA